MSLALDVQRALTVGPHTARSLAHVTGAHPRSVYPVLERLRGRGLVDRRPDGRWALASPSSPDPLAATRARAAVLRSLADGPRSLAEIVGITDTEPTSVTMALSRLRQRGDVLSTFVGVTEYFSLPS